MRRFSPRALSRFASAPVLPFSPERLSPRARSAPPLPPPARTLLEGLFKAAGRRGLPVICGYGFLPPEESDDEAPPRDQIAADGTPRVRFASAVHQPWWSKAPATPPDFVPRAPWGGALYLGNDGSITSESGALIGKDPWAFLERLALLAEGPWLPLCAVLPGKLPIPSHRALALRKVAEASDAWFSAWTDGQILLPTWSEAWFRGLGAVMRFLAACSAGRASVGLRATALARETATSALPAAELPPGAELLETALGRRVWSLEAPSGPLVQAELRGGREIARQIFTEAGCEVARAPLPAALEQALSPRAREYLAAQGARFDPVLHLSFEQLAAALLERGLPFEDGFFDFEARFGGVEWDQATSPVGSHLGVGLFFGAGPDDAWWGQDSLVDGATAVETWPCVQIRGERLLMAGALGHTEERLFVDARGALWRSARRGAATRLAAADGRTFLEKEALRWDVRRRVPEHAAVGFARFVRGLDEALGLRVVEEASDAVSVILGSEDLWVWQEPPDEASPGRTAFVGRSAARVVEAVRVALRLGAEGPAQVNPEAPGGRRLLEALKGVTEAARLGHPGA